MIISCNLMFDLELNEFCLNLRMLIVHTWYCIIMVYPSISMANLPFQLRDSSLILRPTRGCSLIFQLGFSPNRFIRLMPLYKWDRNTSSNQFNKQGFLNRVVRILLKLSHKAHSNKKQQQTLGFILVMSQNCKGTSDHQQLYSLFNTLFRLISKRERLS